MQEDSRKVLVKLISPESVLPLEPIPNKWWPEVYRVLWEPGISRGLYVQNETYGAHEQNSKDMEKERMHVKHRSSLKGFGCFQIGGLLLFSFYFLILLETVKLFLVTSTQVEIHNKRIPVFFFKIEIMPDFFFHKI